MRLRIVSKTLRVSCNQEQSDLAREDVVKEEPRLIAGVKEENLCRIAQWCKHGFGSYFEVVSNPNNTCVLRIRWKLVSATVKEPRLIEGRHEQCPCQSCQL